MTRFAPIDAPAPARPTINLLGAADTPTGANVRWQEGTAYIPESGALVLVRDTCSPASAVVRDRGSRDPIETTAVYAEVVYDCSTLGDDSAMQDRALAALDAELPRAVERELWLGMISRAAGLGNRFLADPALAVDITPAAGAQTPKNALGLLQGRLADVYSGVGIIHTTRRAEPLLEGLTRTGRLLETRQGNRVVPGVGYPGQGPDPLGTPAPTSTSAATGGSLGPDTYEYVVTATNAEGEGLPGPQVAEVVESTLLAAPVQNALATAGTGGSLAAATYFYVVTAINAHGETLRSNEQSITTTGTTSTVTVGWDAVPGATGYRVYRGTAAGAEDQRVAEVTPGGTTTFTDTGGATVAASPPASNTTESTTNTVTLSWAAVTGAAGYRVYGRQSTGLGLLSTQTGTTFTDTGAVAPGAPPPTEDTTALPAPGEAWVYITGMVTVRIGVPESTDGGAVDRATNQKQIRARVPFEVAFDGPVFAVRMAL